MIKDHKAKLVHFVYKNTVCLYVFACVQTYPADLYTGSLWLRVPLGVRDVLGFNKVERTL